MIRSVGSRKASKYKEYIQGCISVLFSYMVGNVMRCFLQGRCAAEKEGFEPSRRFSRPTPFPGEPLRPLGYFSKKIPTVIGIYALKSGSIEVSKSGEDGIRTHVPVRTNGFQDRLVMTASIPLRIGFLSAAGFVFLARTNDIIPKQAGCVNRFFVFL